MLVTRAGDLALEIAAGLSVCLSVWAVRDVSTPIVGSGVEARLVRRCVRLPRVLGLAALGKNR